MADTGVSKDELISPNDVLDRKGLCEYMHISPSTLRRLLKLDPTFPKGKAKGVGITGKKRIWLRKDIIEWVDKGGIEQEKSE